MRKRLFCILLAVSMIGSSLTAYAAEAGEAQEAVSPAAEEPAEGEEQKEERPDGETVPETAPETDEEGKEKPAESPEPAPDELPEAAPGEEPADTEGEPGEAPGSSPAPEESALSDPISEEEEDGLLTATTTYSGERNVNSDMTLDQGWVIDGDLTIGSDGWLRIGNNKLVVNGNVECAGRIIMDIGSVLEVNGNLVQSKGRLEMGGGVADITGDFRLQNRNGAGEYSAGEGYLKMDNASSRLNIGGSFIIQSRNASFYNYRGTMTVKGDVIQLAAGGSYDRFLGISDFKLIMNGNGPQRISIESSNSKLNHLQLDNKDITVDGYFNAILESEDNIIKPADGTLQVTDLHLNGHKMEVRGDMESTGYVYLDGSSGYLLIDGDYVQPSGKLEADGGRIDIAGDYRLQNRNGAGQYSAGEAYLQMGSASTRLNIEGSLIAQSRNFGYYTCHGTMTVKGDVVQLTAGGNNDRFIGTSEFKLVMAGNGPQRISIANSNSQLNYLQLDNKDITADGYFNAILASEDNVIKPADGTLEVTGLKLNNHKLEVAGSIKASGNIDMGGTSGHLVVQGSHVQTAGRLDIGKGRMDITGDLRLQMQDNGGNYDTGDGYLEMTDASGRLDIGGDFIMQSTKNTFLSRGMITLTGDMIQSSANGAVGYVNGTSKDHKTVLMKINSQKMLFDNQKSKVGTLQLSGNKSDYQFSFEPCWIELLTWPFSDVPVAEGWRFDSIKYVYDNNIMNGISGTTNFAPDEPLTRAMFATVLYRMAGNPPVQFKNIFEDVPEGQYYSLAVVWAYNTGIVQGVSQTQYGTYENITREQIAKMLMEYGNKVGHFTMTEKADLDSFPDRSDVSGWATGYIQWAVGSGMVTGKNIGGSYYLDPRGNATRVECSAMLTRFMKRYAS